MSFLRFNNFVSLSRAGSLKLQRLKNTAELWFVDNTKEDMDIDTINEIAKRMRRDTNASGVINLFSLSALFAMIFYRESSTFLGISTSVLILVTALLIFLSIAGNIFLRAKWQRDFQLLMDISTTKRIEAEQLLLRANSKEAD